MDREKRKLRILAAVTLEVRRQGIDAGRIDLEALAAAIDRVLDAPDPEEMDELSRDLDELNAANDV